MNEGKKILRGSESRDLFKQQHKLLNRSYYACDLDFIFVEKKPPGIAAILDYKKPNDRVTFSEVIAYNTLLPIAPIYIIESNDPQLGPFKIFQYINGDWRPEPPNVELKLVHECNDWVGFELWEKIIRHDYRSKKIEEAHYQMV